jgi:ADP-heptose:LPS heptosyltransferase
VWAGGAINVIDRERSLSLEALALLSEVKGVSFYSLQRGPAGLAAESSPFQFAGIQPQTGDFAATAAAISHLDLIVSVDTAVAHLAGALGKPVWILLPARSDWRWLTDRDDSPWYPSAKIFRQRVEGEWVPVIASVAAELSRVAADRAS